MLQRTDDELKQRLNAEVDLFKAIQAHAMWGVHLKDYIDGKWAGKLDPLEICRDDQCELGKWIHGTGLKRFFANLDFHKLRADHARFHGMLAKVVQHMQAEERDVAKAMLDHDIKKMSHELGSFLASMQVSDDTD